MSNTDTPTDEQPIVLVIGDMSLAWDLIHRTGDANWQTGYDPEDRFVVYRQSGGAWGMTRILAAMKKREQWAWELCGVELADGALDLALHEKLCHAYATWTEFPKTSDEKKAKATRVKGYLGSVVRQQQPDAKWFGRFPEKGKERVKLVVVTDDGIEKQPAETRPDLLPDMRALAAQGQEQVPWVVWKDGKRGRNLLAALSAGRETERQEVDSNIEHRTIAIVRSSVLRRGPHHVGHGLSWESLARSALDAVLADKELRLLRWVIVSFKNAGALLVERPGPEDSWRALLVIDPAEMEGTWSARHPGEMVGSTTCLVAAVARGLVRQMSQRLSAAVRFELEEGDLVQSVVDGLLSMRLLHYQGYFTEQS